MTATAKINSAVCIQPLGDTAVTLEVGEGVDRQVSARVMAAREAVDAAGIEGVVEIVPTFRSLTVHFDPARIRYDVLVERLGAIAIPPTGAPEPGRSVGIPVLYDGPDLDALAAAAGMSPRAAAELHASVPYHVYMLGFLPGFAYLGDLPEALRVPRLREPRTRVPAGSVAVADAMSAVYPAESPGGWHLIGRTPLRLFDPCAARPSLLLPGDEVRFEAIDRQEFERMAKAAVER